MPDEMGAQRRRELEAMKSVRRLHEWIWQELYDLNQPFRGDITTVRTEGEDRITTIHDTTGTGAVQQFVNFMMAMIFPSTDYWFRFQDDESDPNVQLLLDRAAERVLTAIADSNFYTEMPVALSDLCIIGNCCFTGQPKAPLFREPGNTFGGLSYKAVPMWRVWWSLDDDGRPLRIIREFELWAVDAKRRFKNPGYATMTLLDQKRTTEKVKFYQWVYPNENHIPGGLRVGNNKRWISEWYASDTVGSMGGYENYGDPGALTQVQVAGYDFQPYMVGLWYRVAGEVYARGLGHVARPDAKGINELTRKLLNALDWKLDPPFMLPDDQVLQFDFAPGGLVALDAGQHSFPPGWMHHEGDTTAALDLKERQKNAIERIFLGDVLNEPETEARSAEAVIDRRTRGLLRITTASNQIQKLLAQVIELTAGHMHDSGALPEFDEIVAMRGGRSGIRVEYMSPLFTAQKESLRQSMNVFVREQLAMALESGDRRFFSMINPLAVARKNAYYSSQPVDIFYSEEELLEQEAAAREAQSREQEMVEAQTEAEIVEKVANATARSSLAGTRR